MSRPNLVVALLLAAGAIVTGVLTAVGVTTGRPDPLVAGLFVVLASSAVDGFARRSVTGRSGPAYFPALAAFSAATAIALLAAGSVVSGSVLLTVAAAAVALQVAEVRRRRAGRRPPPGA